MKQFYTIGIDVGGTNTDGVLVDQEQNIVASCKQPTASNISAGISAVATQLIHQHGISSTQIIKLCIGTTHATNALLTGKDLLRVGVLRIAGHQPLLPAGYSWPLTTQRMIIQKCITVDGGYECDGRVIKPLKREQLTSAVEELLATGVQGIAVIGVFSPLYPDHEDEAGQIIHQLAGEAFPYSLSHTLGGTGFIERENATIINVALQKSIAQAFDGLITELHRQGLSCSVHLTQNNGTLLSLEHALVYPIKTIAAGPTNSCIGAAKLAQTSNAIIIDIGGTSTDVGIVRDGFVRRASCNTTIGGITLNCAMPDIVSIALGGGSYVHVDEHACTIGPLSSGNSVLREARSCGGNKDTLFDVALAHGKFIPQCDVDFTKLALPAASVATAVKQVRERIDDLVRFVAGPQATSLPRLVVGGGALLGLLEKTYVIPLNAPVANAYGAALAELSATIDVVVSLEQRDATLNALRQQAYNSVVQQGADASTIRIVYQDIMPFNYVPGNKVRVVITAAGHHLRSSVQPQ